MQIEGIDAYLAAFRQARARLNKLRGQSKKLSQSTEHISSACPLLQSCSGILWRVSRAAKATFRAVRLEEYGAGHPGDMLRRIHTARQHGTPLLRANLFWAHHQGASSPHADQRKIKDL